MYRIITFLFLCASASLSVHAKTEWVNHSGFSLLLDCNYRGAIYAHYKTTKDNGNIGRQSYFTFDPLISTDCQQKSTKTYTHNKVKFDLGHLVPANHMDGSEIKVKESNYITNIVPMSSKLNRYGAWRETEKLTECLRDLFTLNVYIGVIYGENISDDYFLSSHGIPTPDAFWKVIIKKNGESNAWLIPNLDTVTKDKLDELTTTISHIEHLSGITIPNDSVDKDKKNKTWTIPKPCDLS
ncbi:DNA/RNA non-specific endonuclease [Pseudoalteromonas galatheae]|uniref:DNA/RNA non-specific endonuclease n=1 Tax=Pseudoalteromonas galatheae TaxID=579562 RepID=UPI0030CE25A7